jgi:hypothetical protein
MGTGLVDDLANPQPSPIPNGGDIPSKIRGGLPAKAWAATSRQSCIGGIMPWLELRRSGASAP